MANFYNNFLFNNIFFLIPPFPDPINSLDNFRLIHYNGITIPRLFFNGNYNKKFDQLKSQDIGDIKKDKSIENNNNKDIYISIKNDNNELENNNNNLNLEKKITEKNLDDNNNYNELLNNHKNLFYKKNNNLSELELKLKEEKSFELVPPKSFISIINDGENLNNEKDNYDKINKIISNNINLITNEKNIQKDNNTVLISNIIYKIKNQIIFNNGFQFYTNLSQNKDLSSPSSSHLPKKNVTKQLFTIFSEQKELLTKEKKFHLKRGRKGKILEKNKKKRTHSASDDDNILRKIQVHYLSFIINFINDIIRTLIEDKNAPLFKNLNYKIKKNVKHKFIEELKTKNIDEILQFEISPKMKKHDKTANKEVYVKICEMCPFMSEFLHQNYLDFFKDNYYNKKLNIPINGKIIKISDKTKTFNDLLLKNSQHRDKLRRVAINYFLNTYKRMKKPNFTTYVYEDPKE